MTDKEKFFTLEERKAKIVSLARKHGVFNAIEYYFFRVASWDSDDALDRHNEIGKSDTIKNYQYRKEARSMERGCTFNVGGNAFSLLAAFTDTSEIGVVRLFWNNQEVLNANCRHLDSYFNFQLQADLPNISKLKLNKDWVSGIRLFHQECEKVIGQEEQRAREEELSKLRNDFDLGDFE